MKKIILWGFKLHTHTNSYVFYGYAKAFKSLGYEVFWFDDNDDVSNFNFSNSIFFSEHNGTKNIPIRSDCKYIIHGDDDNHRLLSLIKKENLLNLSCYLKFEEKEEYEKINQFCFYDKNKRKIFMPWATDLLPEEINKIEPCLHNDNLNSINYIGTFYQEGDNSPITNFSLAQKFAIEANKNNKTVRNIRYVSFEENLKLIRESYLSVDFRGKFHLDSGYIPCRIFKSISYGKHIGTNSENINRLLGDHVTFCEDASELYYKLEKNSKDISKEKMISSMNYIKDNHTYINRANKLLEVL